MISKTTSRQSRNSRNDIGVHITTIPQCIRLMRSLDDEAEALIEIHGGRIIHIDRQLYAADAEPIIGGIQQRHHERRANAAPYPIIVHAHAQIGRVVLTTA